MCPLSVFLFTFFFFPSTLLLLWTQPGKSRLVPHNSQMWKKPVWEEKEKGRWIKRRKSTILHLHADLWEFPYNALPQYKKRPGRSRKMTLLTDRLLKLASNRNLRLTAKDLKTYRHHHLHHPTPPQASPWHTESYGNTQTPTDLTLWGVSGLFLLNITRTGQWQTGKRSFGPVRAVTRGMTTYRLCARHSLRCNRYDSRYTSITMEHIPAVKIWVFQLDWGEGWTQLPAKEYEHDWGSLHPISEGTHDKLLYHSWHHCDLKMWKTLLMTRISPS